MARPKKAVVDYFPHYVNHGETLFNVEADFGNDGYAFWFKLLELLGQTEHHYYDCNKPKKWRYLLSRTRFSEEDAVKILDMLAELEAIDGELWGGRIIWSKNFIGNLSKLYSRREINPYTKEDIQGLCMQKHPLNGVSGGINPQSIVEDSKVNKEPSSEPFSTDTIQYRLADYLRKYILKNNPKSKTPENLQKWCVDIDRMIRLDKRTSDEIKEVIAFCQTDSFWSANILSTGKLREKYDALFLKMKAKKPESTPSTIYSSAQELTAERERQRRELENG